MSKSRNTDDTIEGAINAAVDAGKRAVATPVPSRDPALIEHEARIAAQTAKQGKLPTY